MNRAPTIISLGLLVACAASGQIRINEFVAAPSERAIVWGEEGAERIAVGSPWWETGFDDSLWLDGQAPLGYGYSSIQTNLREDLPEEKAGLYLRKSFTASAADVQRGEQLELRIAYDDGVIVRLNGEEVLRRNMGPKGLPVYHDLGSFNEHSSNSIESFEIGLASELLVEGENVLAIQVHDWWDDNDTFYFDAGLRIDSGIVREFIETGSNWQVFPGRIEPSGGVYDEGFLLAGLSDYTLLWTRPEFDDSGWSVGSGPLGYDSGSAYNLGVNLYGEMRGEAVSLYMRRSFELTQEQVNALQGMELSYDYDDGFAAYLNGKELIRENLGSGEIRHDDIASGHGASNDNNDGVDRTETLNVSVASLSLNVGTNTLSAQLHNTQLYSSDLILVLDLVGDLGTQQEALVEADSEWRYQIGFEQPPMRQADFEREWEEPDFVDWIELYNESNVTMNLAGWSLSDDKENPRKWVFPEVELDAGAYLLILADSIDNRDTSKSRLHTNFNLSAAGEFLGLFNPGGTRVSGFEEEYPKQNAYHSYGWVEQVDDYRYQELATPGEENDASGLVGKLAKPDFNFEGGYYDSDLLIEITTDEPEVEVRYTLDGSDPTSEGALVYSEALDTSGLAENSRHGVGRFMILRAVAIRGGYMPSDSRTATFLFNQPEVLKSLPSVLLTGDSERSLFKPWGTSATEGRFLDSPETAWYDLYYTPNQSTHYNLPTVSGRPTERVMSFEVFTQDSRGNMQSNVGARISASGYSKPRVDFRNIENGTGLSNVNKPSFNIFWRDEVEKKSLDFPLFPESEVEEFNSLRLRSGKNDDVNPFIRDELCRRVFVEMGQVGSVGMLATAWLNGEYAGYYNLTERLRDRFFQEWHKDAGPWFVKQVGQIASGDPTEYYAFGEFIQTADFSVEENYRSLVEQVDETNVIDYLMVNAFAATWDWPENNYVIAKSDSEHGKYRLYMWDAEGMFGLYGNHSIYWDTFATDLLADDGSNNDSSLLFKAFHQNQEFRLHFADRVQKHFNGSGALTRERWDHHFNVLRSEITPLIDYGAGQSFWSDWYYSWMNARYPIFFNQLRSHGLWPDLGVPIVDTAGGEIVSGALVTLSHRESGVDVFYTLDGRDPRAYGGGTVGALFESPLQIDQSVKLMARARRDDEWSPLLEVHYDTGDVPSLEVSEISYHPLDTELSESKDLEFLELVNTGSTTALINGYRFEDGIDFTFPESSTIAPGEFLVLVSDITAFTTQYPGIPVFGEFDGQLDNGGEDLELVTASGERVFRFEYNDNDPWPVESDGDGYSLVPLEAGAEDLSSHLHWRASQSVWGSPSEADPLREPQYVVINEVLTHTDLPLVDAVELFNPTNTDVDISGWFLTDDLGTPDLYAFPSETVIPAGGYLHVDESDFAPRASSGGGFRLSSHGESLWLLSATEDGSLSGHLHEVTFPAAENGRSFSRYLLSDSSEVWYPSESNTLGNDNADPMEPAVIISEVLYAPEAGGAEYVEILNRSDDTVSLFDEANPSNTWILDGISYQFPENQALEPGQLAVIVSIDPDTFRSLYEIPESVPIWGPFAGRLDNKGELLSLKRPDSPDVDEDGNPIVPYLFVDAVEYCSEIPWPEAAGEDGYSLVRLDSPSFGMELTNWSSSAVRGGTPGFLGPYSWEFWRFIVFTQEELGTDEVSSEFANGDEDEYANLLEYAFGYDPRTRDTESPARYRALEWAGEFYHSIELTMKRDLHDIEWLAQISFDLETWEEAGERVVVHGSDRSNSDGTLTRVFRDVQPRNSGETRYIRLKAVRK